MTNMVIPKCMLQGKLSAGHGGPLALLNGATARDALLISVPAGVQLEAPVHIIHIASGEARLPVDQSEPAAREPGGASAAARRWGGEGWGVQSTRHLRAH